LKHDIYCLKHELKKPKSVKIKFPGTEKYGVEFAAASEGEKIRRDEIFVNGTRNKIKTERAMNIKTETINGGLMINF
jgi:hypothetical protein